jgi:hypothetical protein
MEREDMTLRGDVIEPLLTQPTALKRPVMVGATLPAWLPLLPPRMHQRVMAGTQRRDTVLVREHGAAFGHWFHVVNMQGAFAAAY